MPEQSPVAPRSGEIIVSKSQMRRHIALNSPQALEEWWHLKQECKEKEAQIIELKADLDHKENTIKLLRTKVETCQVHCEDVRVREKRLEEKEKGHDAGEGKAVQ